MMRLAGNKYSGFSLLEVVLYLGLAAIIGSATFAVLSSLQQSRLKAQAVADVETEGARLIQSLAYTIRSSQAVSSPAQASSASSLTLARSEAGLNPTVFDLANGSLRITEGASAPVQLSSSNVTVSGVSFLNGTMSGARGLVRIQFTVAARTTSAKNHFQYSQTFYDTIAIR